MRRWVARVGRLSEWVGWVARVGGLSERVGCEGG